MLLQQISNPPNPYISAHHEWLEPPPAARLEVYEEHAKTILSENESPDLPFRWSINPYRGCQHACAYCYARPYHEYLGLGAGTDFETKLVAKVNAPQLLRDALTRPKWRGETLNFSGVTDCYQPIEASYGLTRGCLEVCRDLANPVMIITRGALVMRDVELLADIHRVARASVCFSIPFADDAMARLIEPQAPPPSRRFEVMRRLHEAGIPVGVMAAPIIPALNDREIPAILRRAAEAGAEWAGYTAIRLARSVEPVFFERLRGVLPDRAAHVESRIRDIRGGGVHDGRFGARMRGSGPYWHGITELFRISAVHHGLRHLSREDAPARVVAEATGEPDPASRPRAKGGSMPSDSQPLLFE